MFAATIAVSDAGRSGARRTGTLRSTPRCGRAWSAAWRTPPPVKGCSPDAIFVEDHAQGPDGVGLLGRPGQHLRRQVAQRALLDFGLAELTGRVAVKKQIASFCGLGCPISASRTSTLMGGRAASSVFVRRNGANDATTLRGCSPLRSGRATADGDPTIPTGPERRSGNATHCVDLWIGTSYSPAMAAVPRLSGLPPRPPELRRGPAPAGPVPGAEQ